MNNVEVCGVEVYDDKALFIHIQLDSETRVAFSREALTHLQGSWKYLSAIVLIRTLSTTDTGEEQPRLRQYFGSFETPYSFQFVGVSDTQQTEQLRNLVQEGLLTYYLYKRTEKVTEQPVAINV